MPSYIRTRKGNICDIKSKAVIVHGVNCKGVMGSGVALALRTKYPQIFDRYSSMCLQRNPENLLGEINVVGIEQDNLYIVNAFTQATYGKDKRKYVSYDAIEEAFENINAFLNCKNEALTLYFPKIGAGLGGGNWNIIREIIEETVDQKFNPTLIELN